MIISQAGGSLDEMVFHQLEGLFFCMDEDKQAITACLDKALERLEYSFSRNKNKYYKKNAEVFFNPLQGSQYTCFLYYLSNEMYRTYGSISTCDKIYGLLRALSGADLFYEVELPAVFTLDHPFGSVMGRAKYDEYFSFMQGCTVGQNKGIYPTFDRFVFLMSDAKVIGKSKIGHHVIISAGSYVKDEDIPSGSIVYGSSPNLVVKTNKMEYVEDFASKVFAV